MVLRNKFNNNWLLLLCAILMAHINCNQQSPPQQVNTQQLEDHQLLAAMYQQYPEFYPGKFSLDSNDRYGYFYGIFTETKFIKGQGDSFEYRFFKGGGSDGELYGIIILAFQQKKIAIPFDIETGDGLKALNETFTKLYHQISANKYWSKKSKTAVVIDKIFRECLLCIRAENPYLVYELNKYYGNRRGELSNEEKKKLAITSKEYNDFVRPIQDSLFWFRNYGDYVEEFVDTNKYLIYIDQDRQVFVVTIDDEKVVFRFFNPLNRIHFYL